MQAHNAQIQDFILTGKNVFVVPVYQRNYSWQSEHCRKLFNDITQVIQSKDEHFLGTICYKVTSSRERSIIDGQQRLTSVSLLLKAIHDLDPSEEVREEVDRHLYNKGLGIDTDFLRYKLHLNKRDDVVYHILLDSDHDNVEQRLSISQRNSRVFQNYLCFYGLVSEYVSAGGKTVDILEALSMLTIVELEIQQENPQEIFESLNSTGLDLTDVDLLRNYFLMRFSHKEQTALYDDYWSQIEDAIGLEEMVQFFVDYMIFKRRSDSVLVNGRRQHMTEGKLYSQFKDYFRDYRKDIPAEQAYEKTRVLFDDMLYCAKLYAQFVFRDDVDVSHESPIRQKLYYMLVANDIRQPRSLLLYVFDLHKRGAIDDNMLAAVLDAMWSLSFRAKICKANGINRQFAGNVMLRLDEVKDYTGFVDAFWRAITAGKGSYAFPSDQEFLDALVYKDLYKVLRSKGTKYLLYILELHSSFSKGMPSIADDSITVEHIMPQTLTEAWKTYLTKNTMENYETLLHRLGNLALTSYNGEMSNKSYSDKCRIYQESNFYYTRHICNHAKWQMSDIDERSKELAAKAMEIWPFPEEYHNKADKAGSKSLHLLVEDTAQFSYTKPELLLVGDREFNVNFWSEMLPLISRLFEEEDHEAFVSIAGSGRMSFFVTEDDDHDYSRNPAFAHITGPIYVRQQMSAASIIGAMSKMSAAFDAAAGTDYQDNILFTIR